MSFVVPTLDAGDRVRRIHAELAPLIHDVYPDAELILVDDASTDDTWEVIRDLARTDGSVVGVRLRRNVGQAGALCAGFSVATGEVVVPMDDDLECRPSDVPRLVAAVHAGADFAGGRRMGWRVPVRAIGSRLYNARLRQWGLPFHDAGCGFAAIALHTARDISDQGWAMRQHRFKPMVAQLTDRIVEVPFEVRPVSQSHHGLASLGRSWLDVELTFGPTLTRRRVVVVGILTPAAVGVAAVAAASRTGSTARRAVLSVVAATAAAAAATTTDALRHLDRAERRARLEPAFDIAERVGGDPDAQPQGR